MKATEILAKLKEVLSVNDTDTNEIKDIEVKVEVNEVVESVKEEVNEEVVLAEETVDSETPVEVEEKPAYATLSDLTSLKNEILDMLAAYAEVSKEYNKEVPSELNSDKEELVEKVMQLCSLENKPLIISLGGKTDNFVANLVKKINKSSLQSLLLETVHYQYKFCQNLQNLMTFPHLN